MSRRAYKCNAPKRPGKYRSSENTPSRTLVNKGKKRKGRVPRRSQPLSFVRPSLRLLPRRGIARGVRGRILRQATTRTHGLLPAREVAALVLAVRRCDFGECNSTKRHRQRHHERRDQQRNSLLHIFSPPFLLSKRKTGPPLLRGSRLRYWLCPSLTSAHLWERVS